MRQCKSPQYGGAVCSGESQQWMECNNQSCPADGHWSSWNAWTECIVSCGGGTQSRMRSCVPPKYNGTECEGVASEERRCNDRACPVDGYWASWNSWGDCSASCGDGFRLRVRECVLPKYNGAMCEDAFKQNDACSQAPCPVHGFWRSWSMWTMCSVTCGGGIRQRQRACAEPQFGGDTCSGSESETTDCNSQSCPVDGVWTIWTEWGACDVTCGGGKQAQSRSCTPPQYGGRECEGAAREEQTCGILPCPVDGLWMQWGEWTPCDVTCGGGLQRRQRLCNEPRYGGEACTGNSSDVTECNPQSCPVDGYWLSWLTWSECNQLCGGGMRMRSRTCQEARYGGSPCMGAGQQGETCNSQLCPVNGEWYPWQRWTSCTVPCGGGIQSRERKCNSPQHGGTHCSGATKTTRICSQHHCPVAGYWEDWTPWTPCSKSCGVGLHVRMRMCAQPRYGGQPCNGRGTDKRECNLDPCPVDGEWYTWGQWSGCDVSCGGGIHFRRRACRQPQHGGASCDGTAREETACNTEHCPVDFSWQPWSHFSTCTVTCGGGFRRRTRFCAGPRHGGRACITPLEEQSEACGTTTCHMPRPWGQWQPWGVCSVTCAGGTRTRSRACSRASPGPHVATTCSGPDAQTDECHRFPCLPYARTCGAWMRRGLHDSALAVIDPGGQGQRYRGVTEVILPFWVHCDLVTNNGIGVTNIGHSLMMRTLVAGYETSYHANVTYSVSMKKIESLMSVSGRCRQWLRWECSSAVIHNPYTGATMTYWLNRRRHPRYYWGNADPSSGACACGMTGTCALPGNRCNCDANDDVWREDSGYVTVKDDLPITAFYAGDTGGAQEQGYFTIGPLECFDPA